VLRDAANRELIRYLRIAEQATSRLIGASIITYEGRLIGLAPCVLRDRTFDMSLIIRTVTRQDYDQWLPLWDGYNAFYGRSGPTALAPEITRTTWQRFFDAYEPVHALVAESDGRLLGLTHYLFHRSTTAIEPSCYLQDLFTAEAARGKGVASALIYAVYERAKGAGAPRVYWQTHETNLTAQSLYDRVAERSGFIVYRKLF
jgi:GNAT superfamily N-acetyltransferase